MTKKNSKLKGAAGTAVAQTIGIDLGDRSSVHCNLSRDGEVMEEGSFQNTVESIKKHFANIPPARIALEVGGQSSWISRELKKYGHEVLVANARDLRGISQSDRKNDRNDAEKLARYARLDPALLNPITHRDSGRQRDLNLIRARDAIVRARTQLVNSARGMAKGEGLRLPPSVTETFGQRALNLLPAELKPGLQPLLKAIDELSVNIAKCNVELEQRMESYPEAKQLREVPGVGTLTALSFVLTLGDKNRFIHSRDVGAYLGLQPKQSQSGARDPQLGISKAGNGYLRKLLVQCAHHTLGRFGKDSALRAWGLAKITSGGKNAKKRVIVAVARKLAVLLHRLWTTGAVYQPFFGRTETMENLVKS